jgi:glucan biosynthesis protein C
MEAGFRSGYRWALSRSYAPALFAVVSWGPLTLMRGNLKDCDGFTPELLILSAYIGPFLFGWLLYANRDLLPRFEHHIGIYLGLAVIAFLVYGLASERTQPALKAAGNVLLCWLMIFACTGLFLKYLSRPSPVGRYMSDASYWLYIMHMPVVVGFQVALMELPVPALAKIPLALALSLIVLIASYDLFVRPTWIGALLNGRRYARRLPEVTENLTQPAAA